MSKENVWQQKERIANRIADIAAEHLAADAVDEKLFRETMLLNMVHGVLSKEWEQRLLPARLEAVRQAANDAWHRWAGMSWNQFETGQAARACVLQEFQQLIDLIDEGGTE